jgi:hypothetical protein
MDKGWAELSASVQADLAGLPEAPAPGTRLADLAARLWPTAAARRPPFQVADPAAALAVVEADAAVVGADSAAVDLADAVAAVDAAVRPIATSSLAIVSIVDAATSFREASFTQSEIPF